jgi:hypothetical protein
MGGLVRILKVIAGYFLACLAASLVLAIGTLTPQADDLGAADLPSALLWPVVAIGAAVIGSIAMLPALLVIALAEGFAWRSVLLYGALGGVLALALSYGVDFAGYGSIPDGSLAREREVLAASGIAGGLVYWLVAGRKAGAWR